MAFTLAKYIWGIPSEYFNTWLAESGQEAAFQFSCATFGETCKLALQDKKLVLLLLIPSNSKEETVARELLVGSSFTADWIQRNSIWGGDVNRYEPDQIARTSNLGAPCFAVIEPIVRTRTTLRASRVVEWPASNFFQVRDQMHIQEHVSDEASSMLVAMLLGADRSLASQGQIVHHTSSSSTSAPPGDADECPMCLERVESPILLPCCNLRVHRECLASWIMAQAEEGWWPCRCSGVQCRRELPEFMIRVALEGDDRLRRYNLMVMKAAELRKVEARPVDSPRTAGHMWRLGLRSCPSCGAWVERRRDGCNLVTCRCSGRFCFQCGVIDARCRCPENLGHTFLPHEDVLDNYPNPWEWLLSLGGTRTPDDVHGSGERHGAASSSSTQNRT